MKVQTTIFRRLMLVMTAARACMIAVTSIFLLFLPLFVKTEIPNRFPLLAILLIASLQGAIATKLIFSRIKRNQDVKTIVSYDLMAGAAYLGIAILLYPRISYALFFFFGFVIMGAAFSLSTITPYLIALEGMAFVFLEALLDVFVRGLSVSLLEIFFIFMRLLFLGAIAYYATLLVRSILSESEKRQEAESLAENLAESEKKVKEQLTELNQRHKFVSMMRRLDQIIMNTLELSDMAQKIADTISWELGFAGGIIGVLNEKKDTLNFLAISQTPEVKKILSLWEKPFSALSLPLAVNPHYNLCQKALEQRRSLTTNSLVDVFHQVISLKETEKIQKSLKVKSCLIYPLSAKGKQIGLLMFLLREPYSDLSAREIDILEAFVDQSGIAIENALLLYQIKTAHQELQKSFEKLKELDKMKDELVSISSHELRTPMTAIKSYLWMALNKANNLSPKLKRYLEKAYQSSERMIALVNDMLSVSRIDSGRLKLSIKPVDLPKLVASVVGELGVRANEKKIELFFEKPKKGVPKALADEEKIREVLLNLLDNALKFTPKGGRVEIAVKRRGKMVETGVSDTGPGIHKEDLPKLFQKFGRLERSFATMAESGGGTGLGLYISQNIITLHRGKIWVKSKVGEGSTFTFSLRSAE